MKTSSFSFYGLFLASAVIFSLGLVGGAQAQPEASSKKAPATTTGATKKPRLKNLTPRMVKATETELGKPLTPALKAQITEAYRARAAAIAAADEKYYADFAALTGLTVEQAREIDKPARAKAPTAPKVETKTNADQLTIGDADDDTPVTPEKE